MTTVTYIYCNDVVSDNILFSIEINSFLRKIKQIFLTTCLFPCMTKPIQDEGLLLKKRICP